MLSLANFDAYVRECGAVTANDRDVIQRQQWFSGSSHPRVPGTDAAF